MGTYYTDEGAFPETNLASPRRVEVVNLRLYLSKDGGGTKKMQVVDAAGNYSGTSTHLVGGFHTTAGEVTLTEAASSAGDTDANKVFLDTDNNTIRIKKTSGDAINGGTRLAVTLNYNTVDISSVQSVSCATAVSDSNFTGSPSAISLQFNNSSGSVIDPYSLLGNNDQIQFTISGVIIL